MTLSIIVAVSDNGVIGKDNDLIWHLPADLKHFKETTKGHVVIMGRKNYESIPDRFRPLPGRTNIIISRNKKYDAKDCVLVSSIGEAIDKAKAIGEKEAFIIGGGEIYRQSLTLSDKIYLTRVHADFDGDTFFDDLDKGVWEIKDSLFRKADEKNKFDISFQIYEKI
jgi:dihydrofolate reductase